MIYQQISQGKITGGFYNCCLRKVNKMNAGIVYAMVPGLNETFF